MPSPAPSRRTRSMTEIPPASFGKFAPLATSTPRRPGKPKNVGFILAYIYNIIVVFYRLVDQKKIPLMLMMSILVIQHFEMFLLLRLMDLKVAKRLLFQFQMDFLLIVLTLSHQRLAIELNHPLKDLLLLKLLAFT